VRYNSQKSTLRRYIFETRTTYIHVLDWEIDTCSIEAAAAAAAIEFNQYKEIREKRFLTRSCARTFEM
jgi:hypothetical protein